MKTYRYTRVDCAGDVTRFTVPSMWSPEEVRQKLPHSNLYLHVPAKHTVFTVGQTDRAEGPCVCFIGNNNQYLRVSQAPVDSFQDLHFWQAAHALGIV